jgi:hypothetical protein
MQTSHSAAEDFTFEKLKWDCIHRLVFKVLGLVVQHYCESSYQYLNLSPSSEVQAPARPLSVHETKVLDYMEDTNLPFIKPSRKNHGKEIRNRPGSRFNLTTFDQGRSKPLPMNIEIGANASSIRSNTTHLHRVIAFKQPNTV